MTKYTVEYMGMNIVQGAGRLKNLSEKKKSDISRLDPLIAFR